MKYLYKLTHDEREEFRKMALGINAKELRIGRYVYNLDKKVIDCIDKDTSRGQVYISIPNTGIVSGKLYMSAIYKDGCLFNRRIFTQYKSLTIRIVDRDLIEMFSEYIKSKSTVDVEFRNNQEMTPRDEIFRRYETLVSLSDLFKVNTTLELLDENETYSIKDFNIIGRRYIPSINKSGIGRLPHSRLYFSDKGLHLLKPKDTYITIDIRSTDSGIQVYAITDIGYITIFDGRDKYSNSKITGWIMQEILNCSLVDTSKVLDFSEEDFSQLVRYVHTKSLQALSDGKVTNNYVKELSKFLFRLSRRKLSHLYYVFRELEREPDITVVDKNYYIEALDRRYSRLGLNITEN